MKTFPDPFLKSLPPTPEFLKQAADQSMPQGIRQETPQTPTPEKKGRELTWEERGAESVANISKQRPLTLERFMAQSSSGIRDATQSDIDRMLKSWKE